MVKAMKATAMKATSMKVTNPRALVHFSPRDHKTGPKNLLKLADFKAAEVVAPAFISGELRIQPSAFPTHPHHTFIHELVYKLTPGGSSSKPMIGEPLGYHPREVKQRWTIKKGLGPPARCSHLPD